jgi:Nuclease-related domain
LVRAAVDEPQATKAWATGAKGERRLAARLEHDLAGRARLLHDRRAPGRRGNIDHIAIGPSGIWVIDAKLYKGKVERRDVGGLFRTDLRLFVNGRDRTQLAAAMADQVEPVRAVVDDPAVSIRAALCFIDADWALFAKPFQLADVWVVWPKNLVEKIVSPAVLDTESVDRLADRLGQRLPPA